VAVDVDEKGNVRYDAIIKQGAGRDKRMQTSLDDMREREGDEDVTALPAEDEETEATNKTRLALEALLNGKIKQSKPSSAVVIKEPEAPTYVRYTPNPNAPGYVLAFCLSVAASYKCRSTGQTRIIRMVEAQVDPMEPPKHMLKKIPRGPPSPPPPVLHSPPRKLTVEDQQAWKVPPCISNWKNARGYTIPLDKRLAADGRGLQEATINNKFASLTEALYVAERKASEDLRVRDQIRRKMSIREKEDKERELRDLASRARMERAGVLHGEEAATHIEVESLDSRSSRGSSRSRSPSPDERRGYDAQRRSPVREPASRSTRSRSDSRERGVDQEEEDEAERTARVQRERLRIERRKERERELRLENMKGARKNKVDRDANRDVSEKMALNMHKGAGQLTGEAMYDSRLFNQSAGMDSGFGADDEYAAYSKPMFDRGEAGSMYRPKKDDADVYGDADAQVVIGRSKVLLLARPH
jgi:SNW domain-containing protein 1